MSCKYCRSIETVESLENGEEWADVLNKHFYLKADIGVSLNGSFNGSLQAKLPFAVLLSVNDKGVLEFAIDTWDNEDAAELFDADDDKRYGDYAGFEIGINYCPMCGRKLGNG